MFNVNSQLKNCLLLEEEALRTGCTRSTLIWTADVVFDSRVALKCRQNLCTHYGKNFMCPPYVLAGQEFKQSVAPFKLALLIQQERPLGPDLTPKEQDQEFKKVSLGILQALVTLEKSAFHMGFALSLGLGGGNCKICEICGARYGAEACSRPDLARPSMEAVGIDVVSTCKKASFPADFQDKLVRATGLLYIT